VPFRSSKLTHALKEALGGRCRTALLACVWGAAEQARETLGTCRFAQRVARLLISPQRSEASLPPEIIIAQLRRSVAALRLQVAAARRASSLAGGGAFVSQQDGTLELAEADTDTEATLRRFFRRSAGDAEVVAVLPPGAGAAAARTALIIARRLFLEATGGVPAPPMASPRAVSLKAALVNAAEMPPSPQMCVAADVSDEREVAFAEYKRSAGAEAASLLVANKQAARQLDEAQTALRARVAAAAVAAASSSTAAAADDTALLEAKADAHDELASLESDAVYTAMLVDQATRELVAGFERWFTAKRMRTYHIIES
jgi:kinesin family protein 6/9